MHKGSRICTKFPVLLLDIGNVCKGGQIEIRIVISCVIRFHHRDLVSKSTDGAKRASSERKARIGIPPCDEDLEADPHEPSCTGMSRGGDLDRWLNLGAKENSMGVPVGMWGLLSCAIRMSGAVQVHLGNQYLWTFK